MADHWLQTLLEMRSEAQILRPALKVKRSSVLCQSVIIIVSSSITIAMTIAMAITIIITIIVTILACIIHEPQSANMAQG